MQALWVLGETAFDPAIEPNEHMNMPTVSEAPPNQTPDPEHVASKAELLRAHLRRAHSGFVGRETLVELVALSAVAGEHLLIIGPPGTAKSAAVRRVAQVLGGRYFEYLLGRFTEPSEIFGPVDLRRLREGFVETETRGMLPEADFAFIDEVFLGSTAILNTLLGILNERVFIRGHTRIACPLRVCVGASNQLPEDESLTAFADRFLVRLFVESIPDAHLEDLLIAGRNLVSPPTNSVADISVMDELRSAAAAIDLTPIAPALAEAIRLLRKAGIFLTDRRCVRAQNLLAAAAVLDGRTACSEQDLWPLITVVPTQAEQATARDVLRDHLAASASHVLPHAALDTSRGAMARVEPILRLGNELLGAAPEADGRTSWLLKLEGVVREIDASFAEQVRPEAITELRSQIARLVDEQ